MFWTIKVFDFERGNHQEDDGKYHVSYSMWFIIRYFIPPCEIG